MQMRSETLTNDLNSAFIALADPTRRRVLEMLRERPRPAGELAAAFDISTPAISKHLKILRHCQLVREQRVDHDARLRVYELQRAPFDELQAWLSDMRGYWTDQLAAFKAHVEGNQKDVRARRSKPKRTRDKRPR